MDAAPNSLAETGDSGLAAVRAALLDNPQWIAEDAELRALAQAACGNVVDLEAGAVKRLERRAREIADKHRRLRAIARANLAVQAQIHSCVLSVMDCRNARALDDLLDGPLPGRLALDRAAIVLEGGTPPGLMVIRSAETGFVDAEIGKTRNEKLGRVVHGKSAIWGSDGADLRSQALLRIELGERAGLLALGARDPEVFQENQGTELVNFLARAIERRLIELV